MYSQRISICHPSTPLLVVLLVGGWQTEILWLYLFIIYFIYLRHKIKCQTVGFICAFLVCEGDPKNYLRQKTHCKMYNWTDEWNSTFNVFNIDSIFSSNNIICQKGSTLSWEEPNDCQFHNYYQMWIFWFWVLTASV